MLQSVPTTKQWHPFGSIILCSTSNSHMIQKHCGNGKEDVHNIHTAFSPTISTNPFISLSSTTQSLFLNPEEKLWLGKKTRREKAQDKERKMLWESEELPPF